MAGITAAPETGLHTNDGNIGGLTQRDLNNFRISAVIDRLNFHFSSNVTNDKEFRNLFLSLSRGIDFCIANKYVPNTSSALPSLIKQVCQIKNDAPTQSAIMVLMISVKSACQNGWFPDQDSAELNNLAKEVASNFGSASDFSTEPNPSHPVISTVMSSDTKTIMTEPNEEPMQENIEEGQRLQPRCMGRTNPRPQRQTRPPDRYHDYVRR